MPGYMPPLSFAPPAAPAAPSAYAPLIGGAQAAASAGVALAGVLANSAAARATSANVRTMEEQIKDAYLRAQEEKKRLFKKTSALIGQQKAAYAASGVNVGAGSPLDVLAGTQAEAYEDAATIWENARREATGYQKQAKNMRTQQRYANRAAAFNAFGQILSGAAGGYDTYYKLK